MNPEEAVRQLADLLVERPTLDLAEGCQALETCGIPRSLAVRTYHFTQLAWARVLMDGLGVGFSADYLLFDHAGDVVEAGKVDDDPSYAAAWKLAGRFRATPGFQHLVMTAADLKAVNSAILAGSKPANLTMAPAFISLEPLTPEGASKMNGIIEQHIEELQSQCARKKAWWRFW